MITVAIPVGPNAHHCKWLAEAVESLRGQTSPPEEILLIDDMHGIGNHFGCALPQGRYGYAIVNRWRAPWHLGVAHAFNFGVALARNDLVFMLGADDTLDPGCLAACQAAYDAAPERDRDRTYWYVGVKYMNGKTADQFVPCNAAMVSKALWRHCGGFPVESAVGAPDSALISIMMKNPAAGRFIGVGNGKTLYNYRTHSNTDTHHRRLRWQDPIIMTRDILADEWREPDWGRLE